MENNLKERLLRDELTNFMHNRKLTLEGEAWPAPGGGTQFGVDGNGLIVDQRLLTDYRMGAVSAAECGCGWAAIYNALRLLGENPRPECILRELERSFAFVLRGRMGTRTVAVPLYFLRHGYRVRVSSTYFGAERNAERGGVNIIYFVRGRLKPSAHFVTFSNILGFDEEGEYLFRFYNTLSAKLLPRQNSNLVPGRCLCAGGWAGDRRTLRGAMKSERPVFKLIFNISK